MNFKYRTRTLFQTCKVFAIVSALSTVLPIEHHNKYIYKYSIIDNVISDVLYFFFGTFGMG